MSEAKALRADEVDGFFPADSMVRRLHSERIVLFSGARALLMQACEPLGVVGFERHSIIFDDPRTRLQRTDERMSRIYFGTAEQAEATGRIVRAMHRRVRGVTDVDYGPIPAGTPYAASDPALGLWVLATLADSALVYHERIFGSLDPDDRARYWREYRRVGELLGLPDDSMPATVDDLRDYVDKAASPTAASGSPRSAATAAKDLVLAPPFSGLRRAAVTPLHETIKLISIGMLPSQVRRLLGFSWDPAREALLRSALLQLRFATRFWPDPVRLHPAARADAGEPYGALAA